MAIQEAQKPAPVKKVKIFVKIDSVNNQPKANGSINGKEYEFMRGAQADVPQNLAEHMVACGQAIYI